MQVIESNDMGTPVSDFTDENFEDELAEPCEEIFNSFESSYKELGETTDHFRDIARHSIVDVKGDDSVGRKIIVVYACKLPAVTAINHAHFLE